MAIISGDVVQYKAENLLSEAKKLSDRTYDLKDMIVCIHIAEGTVSTLTDLCKKVDNPVKQTIEVILQKTQKKLDFAKKMYHFSQTSGTLLDPRVEKIYSKILHIQTTGTATTFDKLHKWHKKLNDICLFPHKARIFLDVEVPVALIKEMHLQKLQQTPQFIVSDFWLLDESNDFYYKNLLVSPAIPAAVPVKWKKMASFALARNYLCDATRKNFDKGFHPYFNYWQHNKAHVWTAKYIKASKKQLIDHFSIDSMSELELPRRLESVSDIRELSDHLFSYLIKVPLPDSLLSERPDLQENPSREPLRYWPNDKEEKIQQQLETLLCIKKIYDFDTLSAFIEIGHQTPLAMVFHSNHITLFNPSGDKQRRNCYEVNFANSAQAAAFLKKLTDEVAPDEPIPLKPYCHRLCGKISWEYY